MVDICLTCGDAGFSNALIYCDECKASSVHIYCLAEIPANLNDVVWLCEDCDPEPRKLSFSPGSDSLGTKKDSSIQPDSDSIRKAQEDEGRIRTDDKCSTDEALESLDGKNVRLDLGECKELKMNLSDHGEKDEKHGKQVVLEEAESINAKKTDGQSIDLCEIDCSKDGEKYQNYNKCNNLDEVSLNAEARLLKTETHQLAITHSPDNYVPAQPIEQPIWRGHLCIPDKHFDGMLGLVAHLSNIACPRVGEEAKSLPLFLSPELLPRSTLWPKSFAKWGPSDDSIALYFFPDSESSERVFDGLVNDMISRNVAMKAVVQNAELLIFASTLMPMEFWRFQAKFYLWGVFRRKRCGRSAAVANGEPVPVPGEVTQVSDRHSPISPLSNTSNGFCSPSSSFSQSKL